MINILIGLFFLVEPAGNTSSIPIFRTIHQYIIFASNFCLSQLHNKIHPIYVNLFAIPQCDNPSCQLLLLAIL